MRIISQNQECDIPYEIAILSIDNMGDECCLNAFVNNRCFWLGTYKSLVEVKGILWAIAANAKAGKSYYEMPLCDEDLSDVFKMV